MDLTLPPPPDHWLDSTRELWGELAGKKAKSPGRLELLRQGLEARDRHFSVGPESPGPRVVLPVGANH